VVVDHRIAAHFQRECVGAAYVIGYIERLALFHGLQGSTGGDAAAQGDLRLRRFGALLFREILRGKLQRAALIKAALEVVLRLKDGNVFVDGGERGKVEPSRNFFVARAVAVFFDNSLWANKKGKSRGILGLFAPPPSPLFQGRTRLILAPSPNAAG
jgi:hypothetical protein